MQRERDDRRSMSHLMWRNRLSVRTARRTMRPQQWQLRPQGQPTKGASAAMLTQHR
jgi:hypothetical protein